MVISPEEANRILDSNSTSEFDKLRGLPGHCLDPIDWPTACRLVQEGSFNSLGTLGRHPRDTVVYRGFRKQVMTGADTRCLQPFSIHKDADLPQILSKYKNTEAYVKLTIMGYASAEADGALMLGLAILLLLLYCSSAPASGAKHCCTGRLVADDKAGIQDVSIFPLWRPNVSPTLSAFSTYRLSCAILQLSVESRTFHTIWSQG